MSEMTQEEALRHAEALASQALKETETRCAVLGHFINEWENNRARSSAWTAALRELSALHARRTALMRRQSLIRQALECPVGESPAKVPLQPPPARPATQTQRQVQIRARRRS